MEGERYSQRRLADEYLRSKLEELGLSHARVLSVGCGLGEEIAQLNVAGYDAVGIELGSRALRWSSLGRPPERFYIADGFHLPFEDDAFDVVLSNGVIEHIGTVGDTKLMMPDWRDVSIAFCQEMIRVARSAVILTTPNRRFLIDFQHGPARRWPFRWIGRKFGAALHSPVERFYVSYSDLDRWLRPELARRITPLELSNFFGFVSGDQTRRSEYRTSIAAISANIGLYPDGRAQVVVEPLCPSRNRARGIQRKAITCRRRLPGRPGACGSDKLYKRRDGKSRRTSEMS